jgi:predicted transcriptional regulator
MTVRNMPVISVRLGDKELRRLESVAKQEDKDRSAAARELLNDGYRFKLLVRYREGRTSLGQLSEGMDLAASEVLDLLAELGLPSALAYDDYLQGFANLDRSRRKRRSKPA